MHHLLRGRTLGPFFFLCRFHDFSRALPEKEPAPPSPLFYFLFSLRKVARFFSFTLPCSTAACSRRDKKAFFPFSVFDMLEKSFVCEELGSVLDENGRPVLPRLAFLLSDSIPMESDGLNLDRLCLPLRRDERTFFLFRLRLES